MSNLLPTIGSLPLAAALRVEQVCQGFEAAWQAGHRPRIEPLLDDTLPEMKVLLCELLKLELAYRLRGGEQPTLQEYEARFPDHAELLAALLPPYLKDVPRHTGMEGTLASLLLRLRGPGEQAAWVEFVQLYTPLLYHWARRLGLASADAADLVQEVLLVLVRKLPEFEYDRHKSFRGWLRTILRNKWREQRRRAALPREADAGALEAVAEPDPAEEFSEAEYRQHLMRRALQLLQTDFAPTTWKAFWEFVVCGRSARDVAAELGISMGTVYAHKSRVLTHLRQHLAGLLD